MADLSDTRYPHNEELCFCFARAESQRLCGTWDRLPQGDHDPFSFRFYLVATYDILLNV